MKNASTHVWESTKKVLSLLKYDIDYLSPYCSHQAPVELFSR